MTESRGIDQPRLEQRQRGQIAIGLMLEIDEHLFEQPSQGFLADAVNAGD